MVALEFLYGKKLEACISQTTGSFHLMLALLFSGWHCWHCWLALRWLALLVGIALVKTNMQMLLLMGYNDYNGFDLQPERLAA
eukprot:1090695-Pelagomonas_calceolata.AAC.1